MSFSEGSALSWNPQALYRSLEFACIALRQSTEWVLVSGKAILGTESPSPGAKISELAALDHLVALSGRLRAPTLGNLISNLRQGWVIDVTETEEIRLSSEGQAAYSWAIPGVFSVDKSSNPASRWNRAFTVHGHGAEMSSLVSYSTWREIDNQLRNKEVARSFDALCEKLGLSAREGKLGSSFNLSAELPARFAKLQTDSAKGALLVDIECIGQAELMVDWLPQHDFRRVPPASKTDTARDHHQVLLPIPGGATKADLVLSFAGLDADSRTVEIARRKPNVPRPPRRKAAAEMEGRWKSTGKTVGEGGQAQVSIVRDTLNEYPGLWVRKRLKNIDDQKARERFGQEVKATQSIDHPHIVKIISSDLAGAKPYYVAEYCEAGSLQKIGASRYIGDIRATMRVALPIIDAIVAAHKSVPSVIHRDIKPANVLFRKDGTPVIGDFGICFLKGGEHFTLSNEGVGSRNFIAPEMESGHHDLGEPSNRTDVYSLGKVIYWMLSGGNEFALEDFRSLTDLLKDERFEHVHRLLKEMVVRDPTKRIESHEVKERLEMTCSLVEGNFAPLAPSLAIRCRFCGLGKYERFAAYDAGDPSKSRHYPEGTSRLGLHPTVPHTNVRCLRCSHCGHVEWFQLTSIESATWWDK